MNMKPMNIANPPMQQDDHAAGQADERCAVVEHRGHEPRRGDEQEAGQADRQEADDVARQALLRREGPDLALDPDALADGERDRVEDLGEVAADRVLDARWRWPSARGRRTARGGPCSRARLSNGRPRLTSRMTRPNSVEIGGRDSRTTSSIGLEERRAGAQGVGDQGDRVGQLLVERAEPAGLAAPQPEAREHEPDEQPRRAGRSGCRSAGRNTRERSITAGTPSVRPPRSRGTPTA